MSTTMTNAFWREVLDFLPGLTMLFRIDEQEKAHLMFVSEAVNSELGFAPEEYVLASEDSETVISNDLEKLIDAIADLSHANDISVQQVCKLTDRTGQQTNYSFDYRLFRTKSARQNLISVSLFPSGVIPENTESATTGKPQIEEAFVVESPLMSDVLARVGSLSGQAHHVLLRGEKSVGKRTIAEKLARKAAVVKGNQQVWVLDLDNREPASKNERIFAGYDPNNDNESLLDDVDKDLQLVLIELAGLSIQDQKDLVQLIDKRAAAGRQTRIVATSTQSVETLMERGKLDSTLIYKLSFISIFVPPLRERPEDIAEASRAYYRKTASLLNISNNELDAKKITRLLKMQLDGNFEDLHTILREMLLSVGAKVQNDSRGLSKVDNGKFFSIDSVLKYDEMSRLYMERVLKFTEGKIYGFDGAASKLGMKPTTLQSKLKKLHIK